jgi:chaperone BCS1
MASPLLLAQQIFSAIRDANVDNVPSSQDSIVCPGRVDVNATSSFASHPTPSTTPSLPPSSAILNDLPSLILFFFSFSALRDWIKILLFGSILETLRRFALHVYRTAYDSFFITATFEEEDVSYGKYPVEFLQSVKFIGLMIVGWVCYWLSRQPTWSRFALFIYSTTLMEFRDGP